MTLPSLLKKCCPQHLYQITRREKKKWSMQMIVAVDKQKQMKQGGCKMTMCWFSDFVMCQGTKLDQMKTMARSCWGWRNTVVSRICRCICRPGISAGARDVIECIVDRASWVAVVLQCEGWYLLSKMCRIVNRIEIVDVACVKPFLEL